jgi:tetratricopeptide (TPR) repeat protein
MRRVTAQTSWITGSLVAAWLVVAPAPAFAAGGGAPQASSAAQPIEIARARYRQGVEAYKAGHYRESIDYFLEADRVSPSAALSFNIALAYEKIDDAAAALRWYRDYLRRATDAKDRASVEATIQGFEARLMAKGIQQVTVLSDPSAATVLVDDKPVGVTPWTMEIAPGPHRLEIRRDGYETAKQSIELPADHAIDVQVTLQTTSAALAAAPAPAPVEPAAPLSAPAPANPEQSKPSGGSALTTWGIVGLAAGGAALGGALTFELLRRSAQSAAKDEHTQVGFADRVDTMESRQTVARVLLGTGIALAATGGILLFLGHKNASDGGATVGLGCAPGGCVSTLRGRF